MHYRKYLNLIMLILDSEVLYGDDSSAPSIEIFKDKLKQVEEIQSERILDITDV